MSYYVFSTQKLPETKGTTSAEVVKTPDFGALFHKVWWNPRDGLLHPKIVGEQRSFVFEINGELPLYPDSYHTWGGILLFSQKLLTLLETLNVKNEQFETEFIDEASKLPLKLNYAVVRPLAVHQTLDLSRSDVREVSKVKLFNSLVQKADTSPEHTGVMFWEDEPFNKVLVHEQFKREVERLGFTGCTFTPLHDYQSPAWNKYFGESQDADAPIISAKKSPLEKVLGKVDLKDLDKETDKGWQYLDVSKNMSPQVVAKAIQAAVRKLRQESLPEEQLQHVALGLGGLWGEQVQKTYGWQWCYLKFPENDNELLALVSPDRAYCVLPLNFIWQHFEKPEKEETVALLFNMLEKPDIGKKVEPNSYIVLS